MYQNNITQNKTGVLVLILKIGCKIGCKAKNFPTEKDRIKKVQFARKL